MELAWKLWNTSFIYLSAAALFVSFMVPEEDTNLTSVFFYAQEEVVRVKVRAERHRIKLKVTRAYSEQCDKHLTYIYDSTNHELSFYV